MSQEQVASCSIPKSHSACKPNKKLSDSMCEVLISEVQCRPPLWDNQYDNYKNAHVTKKLWDEVGAAVDMTGDDARKKWKILKDTYRRYVLKPPLKSGSAAVPFKKDWKFKESMNFMKHTMRAAPMIDSLSSTAPESISYDENEENCFMFKEEVDDGDFQNDTTIQAENSNSSGMTLDRERSHRSKSMISSKENINKEMLQLEERKIEAILSMRESINKNKAEEDDDYHFFMSLLPFIKPLDPLQKLELRAKMQESVMESYRAYRQHEMELGCHLLSHDEGPPSTEGYYSPPH